MSDTTKILMFWLGIALVAIMVILVARKLESDENRLLKEVAMQAYCEGYLDAQNDAKHGKFIINYVGKADTLLYNFRTKK